MNINKGLNRLILFLSIFSGIYFFCSYISFCHADNLYSGGCITSPFFTILTCFSVACAAICLISLHMLKVVIFWIIEGFTSPISS